MIVDISINTIYCKYLLVSNLLFTGTRRKKTNKPGEEKVKKKTDSGFYVQKKNGPLRFFWNRVWFDFTCFRGLHLSNFHLIPFSLMTQIRRIMFNVCISQQKYFSLNFGIKIKNTFKMYTNQFKTKHHISENLEWLCIKWKTRRGHTRRVELMFPGSSFT